MRFATALSADGPVLYYEQDRGFRPVHSALGLAEAVRDVRELLEVYGDSLPDLMDALRLQDREFGPGVALGDLVLAPPVLEPRAIVCVGRNYAEHITEGRTEAPSEPLLFSKYNNALVGACSDVACPDITDELDYEGELCVIISRTSRGLSLDEAWGAVAGFTIMNDLSARDLQLRDLQWIRGKSLDGFAPTGPTFVPVSECPDVANLRIQTFVNDELRQDALCGEMIFGIPEILTYVTQGITLRAGDLVATGTPAGTAFGMRPPVYLRPGDAVRVSIEPIGDLENRVVAATTAGEF